MPTGPYLADVPDYEYEDCPECGGDGYFVITGTCLTCDSPPETVVSCNYCCGTGRVPIYIVWSCSDSIDGGDFDEVPLEVYDADG